MGVGWRVRLGVGPGVWPNLSSSRFARAAAVAALRLGPALEASAQDSTVRVTGVVREAESNAPVSGALIRIPERGLQTLTSLGGGFAFEAVPDGTYTIRVDRIGYAVIEQVLVVGASDSTLVLAREVGELNSLRLPAYHRLDFRISRNFAVGNGVLQAYLDVFNVYNRANLRGYAFYPRVRNGSIGVVQTNGEELLPILPTIGFRWEF